MDEHQKLLKEMLAVPFSIIPGKDVEPLWEGWFLKRHVTIVVAPGGTGKGLLTLDMAARVTTGRAFPGEPEGTVHEPANVVLVAPEDDPNEAIAWRLVAAGADTSRVFNLTVLPDGSPFIVPDSVGKLHDAMRQIEKLYGPVELVIIDPLFAVVDKPITTNANARRVTTPLERLANETGACVVLTHHTIKDGKVAGVKALTDSVRCVLRLEKEKNDDPESTARIMSVEKTNVLSGTQTLRYVIAGEGTTTCLVWPSEAEQLAESLSSSRGYVIDPDLNVAAVEPAEPGTSVELFQSNGGTNAKSLGLFADAAHAKQFATQKSKGVLEWKAGPVKGSYGAASKTAEGKFTYYSVMPLEA